MKKTLLYLVTILFTVASCSRIGVFEKNVSFENHEWPSNVKPVIEFAISDTSSLYNIYVVVRHTDAYNYNNLWMNIYTQSPGDTLRKQAVDIKLADNNKGWLGSGMDDIFEHRIAITSAPVQLQKRGNYLFRLEQIMRENPLENVLNVGIRVERAN